MKRNHLILLGILLLGAGLRLYGIGAKSLWYDELASANFLRFSILDVLRRSAEPAAVHPPLYFVFLHLWAALWGDSEVTLRSLAAVCGLLTILGTYALVAELACFPRAAPALPPGAALLAAALVALNPLQIQLSQQVRGYSLATALLAWGGAALIRALRGDGRRGPSWILSAMLALGACYTHHLAIVSVASQVLFTAVFLGQWSRKGGQRSIVDPAREDQLRWALTAALIFTAGYLLPWSSRLVAQSETIRHDFIKPIDRQSIADAVSRAACATFSSLPPAMRFESWFVTALVAGVLVGLSIRGGWRGGYLVLTGLLPVVLLVAYSYSSNRSIVLARYLCFAQMSWLAGVAVLIFTVPRRPERSALVAWALALMIAACLGSWEYIGRAAEPGMRAAAGHILRHRKPGEPVVALDAYGLFGSRYYLRGRVRPKYCVPEASRALHRGSEHFRDDDLVTPEEIRVSERSGIWTVSGRYRAWQGLSRSGPSGDWELAGAWAFETGNYWEAAIIVEHYIPEP